MVSTRFAGLDGVSLEAKKVADALAQAGLTFAWFAGELGDGFSPGLVVPEAHFATPTNQAIQRAAFGGEESEDLAGQIDEIAGSLVEELERFVAGFDVDALIIQNALAVPMQLPLGVALTRFITESGIPAVAHHHDFSWERERFSQCAVPEILERDFPPVAPNLAHVVINHDAKDELARRTGIEAFVLPNVMDFDAGPHRPGDGGVFRQTAGLAPDDVVLLQPTRVIPRKGIELTLDLASRLSDASVKVVVTHGGDLDPEYWGRLERMAVDLGVDLRLVPAGTDIASLADAYAAANLVCFPSLYEGFGNALLETFFYRRPVFVNRYSVYRRDIAPTGVQCVEIDGEVTDGSVAAVERLLSDPAAVEAATDANYQIGEQYYSYRVVREIFGVALDSVIGPR